MGEALLSPSASCCFGHSQVPAGCPFVLPLLQSGAAGPAALLFLLITVKLGIIMIKAKMRCLLPADPTTWLFEDPVLYPQNLGACPWVAAAAR